MINWYDKSNKTNQKVGSLDKWIFLRSIHYSMTLTPLHAVLIKMLESVELKGILMCSGNSSKYQHYAYFEVGWSTNSFIIDSRRAQEYTIINNFLEDNKC